MVLSWTHYTKSSGHDGVVVLGMLLGPLATQGFLESCVRGADDTDDRHA